MRSFRLWMMRTAAAALAVGLLPALAGCERQPVTVGPTPSSPATSTPTAGTAREPAETSPARPTESPHLPPSVRIVEEGTSCWPVGAEGRTKTGQEMRCTRERRLPRAHWRPA